MPKRSQVETDPQGFGEAKIKAATQVGNRLCSSIKVLVASERSYVVEIDRIQPAGVLLLLGQVLGATGRPRGKESPAVNSD